MTESENNSTDTYGSVQLDGRGRVTIPTALRDELALETGAEFQIVRDGSGIRLVRNHTDLETVTRDETWGDDAFRDAGESTFGSRKDG